MQVHFSHWAENARERRGPEAQWGRLLKRVTHRVVQQVEPVVEVVDEGEGVRDVVALGAEEQQHGQREVLRTTEHDVQHTRSHTLKKNMQSTVENHHPWRQEIKNKFYILFWSTVSFSTTGCRYKMCVGKKSSFFLFLLRILFSKSWSFVSKFRIQVLWQLPPELSVFLHINIISTINWVRKCTNGCIRIHQNEGNKVFDSLLNMRPPQYCSETYVFVDATMTEGSFQL